MHIAAVLFFTSLMSERDLVSSSVAVQCLGAEIYCVIMIDAISLRLYDRIAHKSSF